MKSIKFTLNRDNFSQNYIVNGGEPLKNSLPPRAAAWGGRNFRGGGNRIFRGEGVAPVAPPLYPPLELTFNHNEYLLANRIRNTFVISYHLKTNFLRS